MSRINQKALAERLNAHGLDINDFTISAHNLHVVDELHHLKNLDTQTIKKLSELDLERFNVVKPYLDLYPRIDFNSVAEPKVNLNILEELIKLSIYNYDAEFGILKDRGKQFLSQDDFKNLVQNSDKLSAEKLSLINLALSSDLDYKKIINLAINSDLNTTNEEFTKQRQVKAEVFKELSQNIITKTINKSQVNPQLIQLLCRKYNTPGFNFNNEIINFNNDLIVKNTIVYRELYNQAKLEDVILDYKNIAQTIDKKTLLPHQNPNYIYTASGREIKYSESSKDLHGSLTSESILLTIDGKVAYQYEKHGPSTPQKLLNQELLNEIQSELNVLMNQSRVKDTDNQEPQKSISEATEISKKVAPSTVVLEKLVNQILEDPLVWQKTWSKLSSNGIPVNPLTGNEYSGINLVNLAILQSKLDTTDNRWCSYKQAAEKEYAVSRGEKSYANVLFFIVKHEFTINDIKLNISGTTTKDTLIELNKELNKQYPQLSNSINSVFRNSENKSIFAVVNELNNGPLSASQLKHRVQTVERYTPVFNFSQMRNTPELEVQKKPEDWQSCIKADFILKAMADATGLNVKNDSANSCFYRQDTNSIHMASPQAFSSPNNYYSALLHEVSHARMRETNAVEDFKLSFNPDLYATSIQERAKEELRAELSAVFTCAKIGLNYDLENHSAYLQSWLKAFKNNPEELLTAANEANKISNAIMDRTHEYLKKNNIDIHEFNEPKYRELDLCAISINKNIEPVVINELTNLNKNESTQSVQTQVENSQEICKDISNNENKEFNDKKINSQEGVEKKNEESTIDDAIEVDNNENITQSRRTRR